MTAPASPEPKGLPLPMGAAADSGVLHNRFLISTVAFQRAKQLQGGARPHIQDDDHKPAHLAVLEVLADTVSWSRV